MISYGHWHSHVTFASHSSCPGCRFFRVPVGPGRGTTMRRFYCLVCLGFHQLLIIQGLCWSLPHSQRTSKNLWHRPESKKTRAKARTTVSSNVEFEVMGSQVFGMQCTLSRCAGPSVLVLLFSHPRSPYTAGERLIEFQLRRLQTV